MLVEASAKAWPPGCPNMRHQAKRFKREVRALHLTGVTPTSCGRNPTGFTGHSLTWLRSLVN